MLVIQYSTMVNCYISDGYSFLKESNNVRYGSNAALVQHLVAYSGTSVI